MNFLKRRLKLEQSLLSYKVEALLITNPLDLYYLTGFKLSAGQLIVTEKESRLFVDGRYYETCLQKGTCHVSLSKEGYLKEALRGVNSIGVDSDVISLQNYLDLKKEYPHLEPIKGILTEARMLKDEDELQLLREAAKLGCEGFQYLITHLKMGMQESEVSWVLEQYWRERGAQGVAFEPIIAFGENSAYPHYRAGEAVLKPNSHLLIDIGVKWQEYHSDMTRVLFVGKVTPEIKKIRLIVEEALKRVLAELKAGMATDELDKIARDFIASKGYGEYFTHSLGHGIGLAIHEPPFLRKSKESSVKLQKNMVITIEPGIYLPGIGGVRLENTVIITENGYENLTEIPYEIHL